MVNTSVKKVRTAINKSRLSGNGIKEVALQNVFSRFGLQGQLSNLGVQGTRQVQERIEINTVYQWYYYDRKINCVPKDWGFSCADILDCWGQCWIGNMV